MKRYWKLLCLTVVIVLVIGTFYIQTSLAGSNLPEFIIDTTSGNAEEANSLIINADYRDDVQGDSLQIAVDGSTYNSSVSFFEQFAEYNVDMRRLKDNYKNFMRGKWNGPQVYYEDEETVAYADVMSGRYGHIYPGEFRFEIDVLDKQSKDRIQIEMDVPEQEKFDYVVVEDVQIIDGVLKVVARNDLYENHVQMTEYRMYAFDLKKQELINEEIIVGRQNGEKWTDIIILNDYNSIDSEKYLLFKNEVNELEPENYDAYELNTLEREFLLYNVETGEKEALVLTEEINEVIDFNMISFHDTISIQDSYVYFTTITENGIEVHPYDIEKKEWKVKQTFDRISSDSIHGMDSPTVKLKDGKIYLVNTFKDKKTDANLYIGDLETGELLFEGIIELKNPSKDQEDYQLHIYDIRL